MSSIVRRPNFFLLGAAKSGTTSIAQYLDQHPEIFVAKPKEPNFFAFEPESKPHCEGPASAERLYELLLKYSVTSTTDYLKLFESAGQEVALGEASVRYLYESRSAARIAAFAPDAKLIVVLRDPVDRLHSHYHMNVRKHIEPEELSAALQAEDERVRQGWGWDWHYRRVGMYARQLQEYLRHFQRSQLLVLFHADLQSEPRKVIRQIFQHLNVSDDFQPDFSHRAFVGETPRWRLLRRLIRDDSLVKSVTKQIVPRSLRKSIADWTESKNRQPIPQLDPRLRQTLHGQFAEDHEQLANLLGRELPW